MLAAVAKAAAIFIAGDALHAGEATRGRERKGTPGIGTHSKGHQI
jgi:hypothetical protein